MNIVRKFVFCEGQQTSLDYQLLDQVLQLPENIEIVLELQSKLEQL